MQTKRCLSVDHLLWCRVLNESPQRSTLSLVHKSGDLGDLNGGEDFDPNYAALRIVVNQQYVWDNLVRLVYSLFRETDVYGLYGPVIAPADGEFKSNHGFWFAHGNLTPECGHNPTRLSCLLNNDCQPSVPSQLCLQPLRPRTLGWSRFLGVPQNLVHLRTADASLFHSAQRMNFISDKSAASLHGPLSTSLFYHGSLHSGAEACQHTEVPGAIVPPTH